MGARGVIVADLSISRVRVREVRGEQRPGRVMTANIQERRRPLSGPGGPLTHRCAAVRLMPSLLRRS